MKKQTIFIISLFMAGISTFLFYRYTTQLSQEAVSQQQVTKVIAAAVQIKKDQKITENMVKEIEVPEKNVHPETVTDIASVVGQYAGTDLAANEVVLSHHLQSLEEASFLSGKIQPGTRAVTIPGGQIETLANMVEPEDRVDIIYTGPPLTSDEGQQPETIVLMENVQVLAVGRKFKSTEEFVEYDSITVEVRPNDAVKLIKATKLGVLHYSLYSKRKDTHVEGS